jgi:hypothetical protein
MSNPITVPTKLKSQEEHHNRGANEHESRQIKRLHCRPKNFQGWTFGFRFGDGVEEEKSSHYDTEWEVDVEA